MVDLSIIMPVYNERATVETAMKRALDVSYPVATFELVVVENGSTDDSREIIVGRQWPPEVRVLTLDRNVGKGGAVRAAIGVVRGRFTTILDADLEYDPADIPSLIEPLLAGEAQAAFGVRGFKAHNAFSFWYVMGGKLVNMAANVLFNAYLSDVTTCHKAMPTELLRSLPLRENGFTIDAEIPARLLRRGIRIFEVPVTYRARGRTEGKKLTARDGFRLLWTLIRCRFA